MANSWRQIGWISVLLLGGCMLVGTGPPYLNLSGKPRLTPIPGLSIFHTPEVANDLYHFDGKWYFYDKGTWYSAGKYNGPWDTLEEPPVSFTRVPREFRNGWGLGEP